MNQFAELTAYVGVVMLKTLKRELMQIIEACCTDDHQEIAKRLIKSKLNNAYNSIKLEATSYYGHDQLFVETLKALEHQNKHK